MSDREEEKSRGVPEKKQEKVKGSAGPGAIIALLLALGLGGYGISTGLGGGQAPDTSGSGAVSVSTEDASGTAVPQAPEAPVTDTGAGEAGSGEEKVVRIEIVESSILVGGTTVSIEELPGILESSEGKTVILADSRARKETYDAVKAVLDDKKVAYSEE